MNEYKYNIELSHKEYIKILRSLRLKQKHLESINTEDYAFPKRHDNRVKEHKKLLSKIYNLQPTRWVDFKLKIKATLIGGFFYFQLLAKFPLPRSIGNLCFVLFGSGGLVSPVNIFSSMTSKLGFKIYIAAKQ